MRLCRTGARRVHELSQPVNTGPPSTRRGRVSRTERPGSLPCGCVRPESPHLLLHRLLDKLKPGIGQVHRLEDEDAVRAARGGNGACELNADLLTLDRDTIDIELPQHKRKVVRVARPRVSTDDHSFLEEEPIAVGCRGRGRRVRGTRGRCHPMSDGEHPSPHRCSGFPLTEESIFSFISPSI